MLLKTKKYLISLLALICVVLFAVVGAVSFVQSNQTAYATAANSETIDFGSDGISFDDKAALDELITLLGGSSYDDLSSKLTDSKTASEFVSAKTVTLSGVAFNIMYVSKADYTANGTTAGDVIVTLWQADTDSGTDYCLQFNPWVEEITDYAYPASMYGSSLIRSALMDKNDAERKYVKTADASELTAYNSSDDNYQSLLEARWAPFKDSDGAFNGCLATPANMAWQESQWLSGIGGSSYYLPNDAWDASKLSGASWYSTIKNGVNINVGDIKDKSAYSDWKNDRVWLPSLTETGRVGNASGLWKTSTTQRANTNYNNVWLRSGSYFSAGYVYYLPFNGYNVGSDAFACISACAVRPALHLNLKSAVQNTDHVHVWESADNDGWVVTTPATCVSKGIEERNCTAANCPLTDSKETREIEIDGNAHTFDKLVIVSATDKYSAFDLFDTATAEVYTHCSGCNQNVEKLTASDLTVTYNNGNCLHTNDTHVSLSAAVGGQTITSDDYSVNVSKREVTLVWEYTTSTVSEENAWVWNEIEENSHFVYDGTSKSYRVRTRFTGADNDPDKDKHYYRAVDGNLLVDGGVKAIENTAVYMLSLDGSHFTDYSFTNNSASIEVRPYEITLSDAEVYRWTLGSDKGSLLRNAYIEKTDDNIYLYYDPTTGNAEGRTYVTRSVVRYRGNSTGLNIVLNGGEIADLFAGTGKRSSIEYSGTTAVGAIGKYTAIATLTLNDVSNYRYAGEIAVADSRGMTIVISENGTKAVITKEWYVAVINNGLLMPGGGEYSVNGWVFGEDCTAVVPTLEHGDENFDLNNIPESDKRISFGLFTDVDMTEMIGETFYRYNFADYINESMPSGNYVLRVSVSEVTDLDGLAYQAFTRTFTFTVKKGALGVTDTLNGKEFEYVYNGKVQLFESEFEPTVATPKYITSEDRMGIWQNGKYDKYYGTAYMTFRLARWQTAGGVGYEFVTRTQLENTVDRKQAPREVDTYIVQYKISALNYEDYGGSAVFTVKINRKQVAVPPNVTETFIKEYVYEVPENADYRIEGNATLTQAGTHTVTLKLKDADNCEWVAGDNVEGNTATVTVTLTMHTHVYGEWNVDRESTCTEAGSRSKKCTLCDYIEEEEVAPLGHDITQHEAKPATCTEKGWNAYETCSRCDHNTYEEIAASGHNLSHVEYKEATADTAGNIEYWSCAECGKYFSDAGGVTEIADKSSVEIPMLITENNVGNGLPVGAVAGIIIGCVIVALVAVYAAGYFFLYRKNILLKGKAFDAVYSPMNAIFKKKNKEQD